MYLGAVWKALGERHMVAASGYELYILSNHINLIELLRTAHLSLTIFAHEDVGQMRNVIKTINIIR